MQLREKGMAHSVLMGLVGKHIAYAIWPIAGKSLMVCASVTPATIAFVLIQTICGSERIKRTLRIWVGKDELAFSGILNKQNLSV